MSAEVQDFYDTLKNLGKKGDGQERDHAEAMTIEAQRKMMVWSQQQAPSVPTNEMVAKFEGACREDLQEVAKHFMVRAYMTSAFTLWTRSVDEIACIRDVYLLMAVNFVTETPSCVTSRESTSSWTV